MQNVGSLPSDLTFESNKIHFPPFDASDTSGSDRTFAYLSNTRISCDCVRCVRNFAIFLLLNILAAAMGNVLEKSDRSRRALADRTSGGRKIDIFCI